MRPVNEKLRVDLLEAGKREFMESGFRGASLKSIAASLGVTTGAIYRYYTDKEALFDGLVREPAQELGRALSDPSTDLCRQKFGGAASKASGGTGQGSLLDDELSLRPL